MDKDELRNLFDKAVDSGDQNKAIEYGDELSDMDAIHVMLGYKKLQSASPETNILAAIKYVQLALRVSRACRKNSDLIDSMREMNLDETVDAANVANMYDHPTFDEYWDYLVHEYMCWNIVAAENSSGSKKAEYMAEVKELMDTTKLRHGGDWIVEYLQFFHDHGIRSGN